MVEFYTTPLQSSPKFALDDTTTSGFLYIGLAPPGAATSAPVWRIIKMPTSPLGVALYAGGSQAMVNIYDNRAVLSYS